jgi:hypothetical protein
MSVPELSRGFISIRLCRSAAGGSDRSNGSPTREPICSNLLAKGIEQGLGSWMATSNSQSRFAARLPMIPATGRESPSRTAARGTPTIHRSILEFELRSSACGADVCTVDRDCGERSRSRLMTDQAKAVCACLNIWPRRGFARLFFSAGRMWNGIQASRAKFGTRGTRSATTRIRTPDCSRVLDGAFIGRSPD